MLESEYEKFVNKWTATMTAEQKAEFEEDLQTYTDDIRWNDAVEAEEYS